MTMISSVYNKFKTHSECTLDGYQVVTSYAFTSKCYFPFHLKLKAQKYQKETLDNMDYSYDIGTLNMFSEEIGIKP